MRAERLKTNLDKLQFLPQTDIETVIASVRATKPALVIIDSIQTMNFADLPGGLGSTSQLTACTSLLLEAAKATGIPMIIIGHVTKDGIVAGPKALEHLVDAVLYLERDDQNFYQILRSVKNRFGASGEIGIFEMTAGGFKEIKNPAEIFLSGHGTENLPGIATTTILEGSRPFLAEIQALVTKTAFGYPQRRSTGFDLNRLQMLIAVLAKTAGINLGNHDVYLNVAGGLKIKETAADLAVCLAVASAFLDLPLTQKTLAFGEIGLSGEIRNAPQAEVRLKEAKKLGFKKIIMPAGKNKIADPDTVIVKTIAEAIQLLKKIK
jgi:DNA repair protein RadA/Sms